MTAGSEGVWVVRDPSGKVLGVSMSPSGAIDDCVDQLPPLRGDILTPLRPLDRALLNDPNQASYEADGYTLRRLPLATPEQIRVLEMVAKLVGIVDAFDEAARTQPFNRTQKAQHIEAYNRAVDDVVAAHRPTIKDSLTTDAARAADEVRT
ncbi:hypothetical protein [Gemmatimonas aurantiaca]|nr:hypothetical protein [Gemmatimonas aurantiaca]